MVFIHFSTVVIGFSMAFIDFMVLVYDIFRVWSKVYLRVRLRFIEGCFNGWFKGWSGPPWHGVSL